MPETITIPKDEYERLKSVAMKIKLIDETIHENLNSQNLMRFQESQKSLEFLKKKEEDTYNMGDLKEVWKKGQ